MESTIDHILADLKSLKVLIAEDDPVAAKVLEMNLARLGLKAVVARDGTSAWEAFEESSPEIVLTDWEMPGFSGIELCKKIRAAQKPHYTHVTVLTAAFTEKQNYLEAMEAGADDFLRKPYERDELAAKMCVAQRIINFHAQMRELRQLVPICSYCKSVRDDRDYWHRIETYLQNQTGSRLTHGICPKCAEKYFNYPSGKPDTDDKPNP